MVKNNRERLYKMAHLLAIFTIAYNLIEGLASMGLGAADETLALFGFGVDSFIEVVSAVGVWHMLGRIRAKGEEGRDQFEQTALRITGGSFYALTVGLIVSAIISLQQNHHPETTFWGIIISGISISFMWFLIRQKMKVGRELSSPAILADAACSKACLYLSLVLMASSIGYELTGIGSLDAIGALLIAFLSWKEGREAFGKAAGLSCSCSCNCKS